MGPVERGDGYSRNTTCYIGAMLQSGVVILVLVTGNNELLVTVLLVPGNNELLVPGNNESLVTGVMHWLSVLIYLVGELIHLVSLEPGPGPTDFCIWSILSYPAWVAHRDCIFYFALLGMEGETLSSRVPMTW